MMMRPNYFGSHQDLENFLIDLGPIQLDSRIKKVNYHSGVCRLPGDIGYSDSNVVDIAVHLIVR